MNAIYIVELSDEERKRLLATVCCGVAKARTIKRAQILLAANRRQTDREIAAAVSTSTSTAFRTRRKYLLGGIDHALSEAPRPGAARKLRPDHQTLTKTFGAVWTRRVLGF